MAKTHSIFFALLIFSFFVQAQEGTPNSDNVDYVDEPMKLVRWGFTTGLDVGWMGGKENPSDTAAMRFSGVHNPSSLGVNAGVTMSYMMNKFVTIRPSFNLCFMPTHMNYSDHGPGSPERVQVSQLSTDFSLHLIAGNPLVTKKPSGFIGGSAEIVLDVVSTQRVNQEMLIGRIDFGIIVPTQIGNSTVLIDVFFGQTLTPHFGNETPYEQWWENAIRQRVGVRMHIH